MDRSKKYQRFENESCKKKKKNVSCFKKEKFWGRIFSFSSRKYDGKQIGMRRRERWRGETRFPLGSYAVYFCGSKLTVHGETSLGTPSWRLDQLQPRVKLPPKLVEGVEQRRNTRSPVQKLLFLLFFRRAVLLINYPGEN